MKRELTFVVLAAFLGAVIGGTFVAATATDFQTGGGSATSVDSDTDGTDELSFASGAALFDIDDDGTVELTLDEFASHDIVFESQGLIGFEPNADGQVDLMLLELGTDGISLDSTGDIEIDAANDGAEITIDSTTIAFDPESDGTDNAVWTGVSTDGFTLDGDSGNGRLALNASIGAQLVWSSTSSVTLDGGAASLVATGSGDDVKLTADDRIEFDAGGGGADAGVEDGHLFISNGADPGATCTVGSVFLDTDETVDTNCTTTADNSLCVCTAANTWTALENN